MTVPPIIDKNSVVGIIGWPVNQNIGPAIYNAIFAELKLNWVYVHLPVKPNSLKNALAGLDALGFVGVNVTTSHKQAVMRYMDELSDTARFTGSVNTIHIKDGRVLGYNTIVNAFLNTLKQAGYHPKGMKVAVLGAGGAARAVTYALVREQAGSVIVLNRTARRAAFLVDDLTDSFPDVFLSSEALTKHSLAKLEDVDIVINSTSMGMYPNISGCPWPDELPIPSTPIFFDLVYSPLETTFLARATATGSVTIGGLGMLVNQVESAFRRWTGCQPSIETIQRACLKYLA